MEPVAIPKTIDDPIHLLLWSADEIVPFMVCILIDQFIPALAISVIAVKFYRRFRDNRPDGYTLHSIYWLGLPPGKAITIPNPFIRRFYPCGCRTFFAPGKGMRPRTGSAALSFGLAGGLCDHLARRLARTASKLCDLVPSPSREKPALSSVEGVRMRGDYKGIFPF